MWPFKKHFKKYFERIIIIDPLEDDLVENNCYVESYEKFCKIHKIDPKTVYIMFEDSIAYSLSQLISLKSVDVESKKKQLLRVSFDTSPITWITNALIIVNEKRANWIPGNYANIQYHINLGLGYTHRELRCIIPSNFGVQGIQFDFMKSHKCNFAVCQDIPTVPGDNYIKYLNRNFKEIKERILKHG